jgi:hypothetical protein
MIFSNGALTSSVPILASANAFSVVINSDDTFKI